MTLNSENIRDTIRTKVIDLARNLGVDANELQNDEMIPATGFLDSAAILELIVWYENEYRIPLKQEEINIDNLGSVNAMVDFLIRVKKG